MNLSDLDIVRRNELAREFATDGATVLEAVELPPCFDPPLAHLVFFKDRGECVVHIGADAEYRGSDPQWRAICHQSPTDQGTREVTALRGDFITALGAVRQLLEQAEAAPLAPPLPPAAEVAAEPPERRLARPGGGVRARRGGPRLRDLVGEQRRRPREYVGRAKALSALKAGLCRESKPGTVLIGLPGVGKTALVEMLAADIAADRGVPGRLRGATILELPLGALLEGGGVVGDIERQVRVLIEHNAGAIFFLDEIHQIGRRELYGVADLLKPALAEGRIRVIGATTPSEWRQVEDAAFKRRFVELQVEEPTPEEAHRILHARVPSLSGHHDLQFEDDLLREAVMLADRYLPLRRFPDKVIDLIDQAAALQANGSAIDPAQDPPERPPLDRACLYEAAANQSHIARGLLETDRHERLLETTQRTLRTRLKGQDAALARLGETLRVQLALRAVGWGHACAMLRPTWDRRPLATLLACGPTGVGKSETARILAQALFGGSLIVLNGSDVGTEAPHGTSMWTGSPPGYVGNHLGGVLTNGLREHPAAVILVDEMEKASPEAIQNVLLPLLGDGVVTDRNTGESLWASNCVVLCTTNIDIEPPRLGNVGFGTDPGEELGARDVFSALSAHFRPEVIGRFNAILRYDSLTPESQWAIWDELVRRMEARVGGGACIRLDEPAHALVDSNLAEIETGARGIEDLFRRLLLPTLAEATPGSVIHVTAGRDRLDRVGSAGAPPAAAGSSAAAAEDPPPPAAPPPTPPGIPPEPAGS